ncbi:MAG: antitermination protein NusB [Cytophagales bacterium CG12_big_fil_rev_8_21_14_0_65_40_12]|nr:MAG: antitermination protein NusB [Cytophagales bacterium CG12_big_fil_rev_8_21_14_0_65_40_12]PIW04410.1 MAG: antitermination protein NusB [Cytophagales bacterium CG17_big_fil_post_rev_8_21_14_2_50_40_13]
MEKIYHFEAVIQGGDERWLEAACVALPFNVEEEFGTKGQVKVRATFDGVEYRGSIANMGAGHILILRNDVRQAIGKVVGDMVLVTVQKDTEERIVEVPDELQALLNINPKAEEFYNTLSYTNRKEYVRWITSAKKQETKDRRLEKSSEMLLGGIKTPG